MEKKTKRRRTTGGRLLTPAENAAVARAERAPRTLAPRTLRVPGTAGTERWDATAWADPTADRAPADGRQLVVPGVAPRGRDPATVAPLPDDAEVMTATLKLTRGAMRAQRVAVALAGGRTWQEWALRVLNAAAGVSS